MPADRKPETPLQKKLVTRRLDQLRQNPRQRDIFEPPSPEAIAQLAGDICRNGLIHPVEIARDNTIIAGHSRVAAAKLLQWRSIQCWVRDDLTKQECARRHVEDNLMRRQLGKLGQARAYRALKQLDDTVRGGQGGDLRDIIGKQLGLSGRTLDRLVSVLSTPIEVQTAFDDGQITLLQAGEISRLQADTQRDIAEQLRSGRPANDILEDVLPSRQPSQHAGRALKSLTRHDRPRRACID